MFTTVADWVVCVSDGISRALLMWPLPLPNSAVPIGAMPMAAPIRCAVFSAAPAQSLLTQDRQERLGAGSLPYGGGAAGEPWRFLSG